MRTALAIGGTSALAALSGCAGGALGRGDGLGDVDVPQGPSDPSAFPERQHAWDDDLKRDPFGNVVLPNHQLLLFLDYRGSGGPTAADRETVETSFRTLERAFQRLTGGDPSADNEGLVLMAGYTPKYFGRFDTDLPESVDLQSPEAVLRKTNDDVDKADSFDALVLLSSDTVPVLLAAEEALFGGIDTVNGIEVETTIEDVFRKTERRTAFVGPGMPRDRLENEEIHEDAPLSMGYKSGFRENLATEDRVTITEGPFAQGTTMQVSKLRLDLGEWYENDRETRDELMFSHAHSREDIGDVGEGLEDDSQLTEEVVDQLESQAKTHGRVGHSAKTAQARDDDFKPLILRRSEGINDTFNEDGRVDFNFTALMEGIEDFIETRRAMDSSHLDEYVEEGGHGIVSYMEVTNRATVLIPPRSTRALPTPNPST
ncbi:DUF7405 family protein [Salinigranum sp. GCM10025319]|uniref:DUF7405 family protein n=1 Tax=Salinigranum sp. GCM10025319 TaxID=3252687 RepID=UPI00362081EF